MNVNNIVEAILEGEALLFLGSGFSVGCKNLDENWFPIGKELAGKFYGELGEDNDGDLYTASEMYLKKYGADKIIEMLRKTFRCSQPTPNHNEIFKNSWKNIYTTNYDDIVEVSHRQNSKNIVSVTTSESIEEFCKIKNKIIHINGYIEKLDRNTLSSAFKLTDTSYLTQSFIDTDWSYILRKDFKLAKAIIFIGYSMYDFDIRKIFHESDDLKNKVCFITEKSPSNKTMFTLERFGTVLPIELSGLVSEIALRKTTWVDIKPPCIFNSFVKFSTEGKVSKLHDNDLHELHLYGKFNPDLLNIADINSYVFTRKQEQCILNYLVNGNDVLIHSSLGNGKTILCNKVAYNLHLDNWDVYILNSKENGWENEVDLICDNDNNCLVIIENYHRTVDVIRYLNVKRTTRLRLLLSERSDINDLNYDNLEFLNKEYIEIDLNKIDRDSQIKIIENFNKNGLWGSIAAKGFKQKQKAIEEEYKSEFSLLLLDVFKSPNIEGKIKQLINTLNGNSFNKELIIFASVCSILGYEMDTYDAADYLSSDSLLSSSIRNENGLKELIGLNDSKICIRSSILAKHILLNMNDPNSIIDVLLNIVQTANKLPNSDYIANNLKKDVVRFGNIQAIIPKSSSRENAIIRFYEYVKNVGRYSTNPHFWLQYAIAQLEFKKLDTAETYFNTAYSFAKSSSWYDTEPLDNHYARFLLEKSVYETDTNTAFSYLTSSHNVLRKPRRRHYPYRVATGYLTFYKTHKDKFTDEQLEQLVKYCNTVLDNISKLETRLQEHRHVVECKNNLQAVLDLISSNVI